MSTIIGWITSKIAGPIATGIAILALASFAWQTAQIDGWPIFGGGYKAQVASLTLQLSQAETASAKFRADAQAAEKARDDAVRGKQDAIAAAYQDGLNHAQPITQTIIQKVPAYVSAKSDADCIVPVGFVRLFDAAASGNDPGAVEAAIYPGQPDDAASPSKLSDIAAMLAKNFGAARDNASQLTALEAAAQAERQ